MMTSFLTYLLIFFITLLFPGTPVFPADRTGESYETPYAAIYYYHEDESDHFNNNIKVTTSILKRDNEKNILLIEENIDKIVYKVKRLLGMFPHVIYFSIVINKDAGNTCLL